jgi:hypothetical protein
VLKKFSPLARAARFRQARPDRLHLRLLLCRLGPWPGGQKAFEADCNCELKFVALEDGVSLLNRLRMEGKNSKADVVLGLDNNLLEAASQTKLFAKSGVAAEPSTCRAAGKTTPLCRSITATLLSSTTKTS